MGQDASFTVLAYPGEEFQGKVVRIGNRVEAESRTMEVRIEADNADARLKPGMFADVEIVTTIWQDTLLIADTALRLVSAGLLEEVKRAAVSGSNNNSDSAFERL